MFRRGNREPIRTTSMAELTDLVHKVAQFLALPYGDGSGYGDGYGYGSGYGYGDGDGDGYGYGY